MGNKLDKTAVLNRIKEHYSLKGNADLARFLGVAPNTITNWYSRRTFDIDVIYTKCEDIDLGWLLTGRGEMLKSEGVAPMNDKEPSATLPNPSLQPSDESLLYTMYKEKEAKIEAQAEQIGSLKQQIKQLESTIEGLQHHAHPATATAGSARTRKNDAADLGDVRFAEQL